MDVGLVVKNLHPLEIRLLRKYSAGTELTVEKLQNELEYKEGHANQAFSWLVAKGLAQVVQRTPAVFFEITPLGLEQASSGTPEQQVISYLKEKKSSLLPELASNLGFEQKDIGSVFGLLSKEGVLVMDSEKKVSLTAKSLPDRIKKTELLLQKAAKNKNSLLSQSMLSDDELQIIGTLSKKRGAADVPFRIVEREVVVYILLPIVSEVKSFLDKSGITGSEIGSLTSSLLVSGSWKGETFRSYNISVPPARIIPGRTNSYVSFLESVKDKLASLGFEEFDGDLVETEFWNSDALFMPQFHAARDIHDVYYLKEPTHAKKIDEPFLTNIAQAHKNGGNTGSRGWNYNFDNDFTRRLILRSQGTVLSAHQLATAKKPGKYFGIARVFRYDKVDATHLSDFYQTEGIVLGDEVSLKTLLGFLEMFAVEIAGATDIKYVPGYFPFTEPSIEVHIKHPVLGWFELGGSGIFRPEVSRSLGVDCPVLAWGIGIDRMALMALGLNDLRELFSSDIDHVRLRCANY
ncbi:MAG: phenylalanine--tRNA ligase subunit alpha [Treponemataceae bacterium]